MRKELIVEFDPKDINRQLGDEHRNAMLNLVLAWGSLDGALGAMLSRVLGVPFHEGADLIGKSASSKKFEELRKHLLAVPDAAPAAAFVRKLKRNYEKYSKTRNCIAHSHCAGIWSKYPEYVVFAKFERADGENLAVDFVPLDEMHRATKWGNAMTALAMRIADAPYD